MGRISIALRLQFDLKMQWHSEKIEQCERALSVSIHIVRLSQWMYFWKNICFSQSCKISFRAFVQLDLLARLFSFFVHIILIQENQSMKIAPKYCIPASGLKY